MKHDKVIVAGSRSKFLLFVVLAALMMGGGTVIALSNSSSGSTKLYVVISALVLSFVTLIATIKMVANGFNLISQRGSTLVSPYFSNVSAKDVVDIVMSDMKAGPITLWPMLRLIFSDGRSRNVPLLFAAEPPTKAQANLWEAVKRN